MVSVIIPSYNRASTIEKSVRSVLNQTYRDIELIVVDDCSTDNTKQVLEQIHDDRLRYHCLEKNSGACAARNKGIELARGEYIAFQDSDDEWLPHKLETQLKAMQESGTEVCFCKMRDCDYPETHPLLTPPISGSKIVSYKILYTLTPVGTQSILAKREVFENIPFDKQLKKAQDVEWTFRAGRKYRFYYVDEVLVKRYLQADSITMGGAKKSLEAHQYILNKYKKDKTENPGFYLSRLKMVGRLKVLNHLDASQEFKEVYEMTRSKKDFAKYCLAKTGLINICYQLVEKAHHQKTKKVNQSLLAQESQK